MSVSPVRGVEALNRAFTQARAETRKSLPALLGQRIKPIETSAEHKAATIGAGVPWSQMRSSVGRHAAYVAPVPRGTKLVPRKRPKFARRLLSLSMEPALNENREAVGRSIDALLARIERQFNRG